jgi:hypothetical protein
MLMTNYCICQNAYDQTINYDSWTPLTLLPMHKSSYVDLLMFDTEDDNSFSIDLKIFDIENSKYSNSDDRCHHIKKVSASI